MNRKFAFKLLFYCLFILYLLGDLHLWHGPLAGIVDDHMKATITYEGDDSKALAYVYGDPVTERQVERRRAEMAFLRGVSAHSTDLFAKQQYDSLATSAKMSLIRGDLLRLKTRYNDMNLPDTMQQAKNEINRIASRFGKGGDSFGNVLAGQKTDMGRYNNMIAGRLKQRELLENFLSYTLPLPESEIKVYYDEIKDQIKIPQRRELKHVFLATLDKDADSVKKKAEEIFHEMEKGGDFAEFVKRYSEDSGSAPLGGDLGMIAGNRADLLKGVDLFSLPEGKLTLVQSNLGWHIFLAGPILPARVPSFEEALPVIKPALDSMRRDRAVTLYMDELLKDAQMQDRVWIEKQ